MERTKIAWVDRHMSVVGQVVGLNFHSNNGPDFPQSGKMSFYVKFSGST